MTVIYKRETIQQALDASEIRRGKYGSQRGLIGRQCNMCFMSFESLKRYPRQICALCRYELAKESGIVYSQYIKEGLDKLPTEDAFYAYHIGRGLSLQRNKERTMSAKGVKLTRVLSKRLSPFEDMI